MIDLADYIKKQDELRFRRRQRWIDVGWVIFVVALWALAFWIYFSKNK